MRVYTTHSLGLPVGWSVLLRVTLSVVLSLRAAPIPALDTRSRKHTRYAPPLEEPLGRERERGRERRREGEREMERQAGREKVRKRAGGRE